MILPLLLQAVPAPAPSATPDEVVVIGQRLRGWHGTINSNPLYTRCRIDKSSGDRDVDALACKSMRECWPAAKVGLKQSEDRRRDPAERDRIASDAKATFGTCIAARQKVLVAELATRRAAAGGAR